jgi:DNA-binding NtrC family response regulator
MGSAGLTVNLVLPFSLSDARMQELSSAASLLSVPIRVSAFGGFHSDLPGRLATGSDGKAPSGVREIANGPPVPTARTVHRVLWIDDEVEPDDAFLRLCTIEGFRVDVAGSGAEGLATASSRTYDAVIIDLHLPDMFGLTVLHRLRGSGVAAPVLAVTGYYLEPEIKSDALRAGATAFGYKPLDSDEIVAVLRSMIAGAADAGDPATTSDSRWRFGIVAVSPAMQRIVEWIDRVGPMSAHALVTGETGTGKELVARALHQASARAGERFVPVNCAAIPEGLVETELFGHRKGAFTGASSDKEGVFEAAHRGTLFLDEIGDLPLSMQGRLLRCLENGEIRRVGDTGVRRVDARIIAATNRSLRQEVNKGGFREDLYHRLAVARQNIPPLRERLEDLEALVQHWLPEISRQWNRNVVGVTLGALTLLRAHSWPGNARELRNVLEQSVCGASSDLLNEREIGEALFDSDDSGPIASSDLSLSDDARRVLSALDAHHWNRTKTARALGVNRTTLWRWLERHGFREDKRKP